MVQCLLFVFLLCYGLIRHVSFNQRDPKYAEVGKAQLEGQSPTSATFAIAEVALRTNVFKICSALIVRRFNFFLGGGKKRNSIH